MRNLKKNLKIILTFFLVIILCLGNVYSANAAKKIKSKSVSVSVNNVVIGVGDVVNLSAQMKPANSTDSLKWSTSDKKIATVNSYGVVTGKAEGTVTITVKTSSNKKAKCKITVKKYLTQEEIINLISNDCIDKETVLKLIEENKLSEDKVKELIKNNTLSEDVVKKIIAENSLTEESVKELIKNNTLSEDVIKKLIEDNALSEEDVKKIIQENMSSDSSTNSDWEDGTALNLYSKQSFPMRFEEAGVTITDVTVKKYHYDDFVYGGYHRFKYTVEVHFVLDEELKKLNEEEQEYVDFAIHLIDDFNTGCAMLQESRDGSWNEDENGICFTFDVYANKDMNEYLIYSVEKNIYC